MAAPRLTQAVAPLEPMYASTGDVMPVGDGWTFEPKYDGVRALAFATPDEARLFTRNGHDKARQFPEIVDALRALARRAKRALVLDGEIVALDGDEPARFQALQPRVHVQDRLAVAALVAHAPAAYIAFDILMEGHDALLDEPWRVRRAHLEKYFRSARASASASTLRLGDTFGDGRALLAEARTHGWEGILAKRTDIAYLPGVRTKHWLKLKVEHRQEFVVGGWTEPRNSRAHLGALLLGYYDAQGTLQYAGHTGAGFTDVALADMSKRLRRIVRTTSPFAQDIRTNAPAHYVEPALVVEVKFGEWTDDGKLRHPVFVGLRDDKDARDVVREG